MSFAARQPGVRGLGCGTACRQRPSSHSIGARSRSEPVDGLLVGR